MSDVAAAPVRHTKHISGHEFTFTALNAGGLHSGRQLYRVWCQTCQETVHEATTGPEQQARYHVKGI